MQSKTAFVIEDDKDICALLSIFLKSHNFEVVMAHSLASAGLMFAELQPDCIFVDHRLPDGYGFGYINELKQKFPTVLIIAMTAQHSQELKNSILASDNTYYLEKPFRITELNTLILTLRTELS